MWFEIAKYLPEFPTSVLTGFDAAGQPISFRIRPQPDPTIQAIRFSITPGLDLQTGKACLLCHRHDEHLWNLKSFVVQGILFQDQVGWLLKAERFIPGMGIGGLSSYIRFVSNGRKNTNLYLQKHGLTRPKVNWEEITELMVPDDEDA